MSDPSLSPLVRQAARNLHTVEWLSENNNWRSAWFCRRYFWRTRRMMTRTPDEAAGRGCRPWLSPSVVKKMPIFWLNLPGSPFRSRYPRKPSPGATDSSRSGNSIRLPPPGRKPSIW